MAPPSGGGREVTVEIDEDGAGDMPGGVLIAPPPRIAQVPAHVSDAQLRVADTAGEIRGADERPAQMLAHGFAITLLRSWPARWTLLSRAAASVAQATFSKAVSPNPPAPHRGWVPSARGCCGVRGYARAAMPDDAPPDLPAAAVAGDRLSAAGGPALSRLPLEFGHAVEEDPA